MTSNPNRRAFHQQATALGAGTCLLGTLPAVSASEAIVSPDKVQFDNGIEPVVKLIENSSRGSLIEVLARRIKSGLSYKEVLAGLLLAGVRNVQPRPAVGFKFHCVLVINSCHLASLSGPDSDRWLPLLWAADYFKSSQASEKRQSGWKMASVDESKVPNATAAEKVFHQAMKSWDIEKADAATAALCRFKGATEVFNLFARYAARDYRSIGHKAIYLANSWRTLQVIGWRFAEPVMRSLAFALLNHNNEPNPAKNDLAADRPWRENKEKIGQIPDNWLSNKVDHGVPPELLEVFRKGEPGDCSSAAAKILAGGVSPQSIWDGVFLGAGELLMRQPGIIGLHALTTANAMHFLWKTTSDQSLRKRLLLQACSFNPMFRKSAKSRGKMSSATVDQLKTDEKHEKPETINKVLAAISSNRMEAAVKLRSYLESGGNSHQFVAESRRVMFEKGTDAHDYKFSSAVLEDYANISPQWRDEFLAMSVFNLKGTGHPDNRLINRIRTAV